MDYGSRMTRSREDCPALIYFRPKMAGKNAAGERRHILRDEVLDLKRIIVTILKGTRFGEWAAYGIALLEKLLGGLVDVLRRGVSVAKGSAASE